MYGADGDAAHAGDAQSFKGLRGIAAWNRADGAERSAFAAACAGFACARMHRQAAEGAKQLFFRQREGRRIWLCQPVANDAAELRQSARVFLIRPSGGDGGDDAVLSDGANPPA